MPAVVVNEVGPRDGLQNQPKVLEPGQKLELIHTLIEAGIGHIEVGAFVSPRAVPAMAGTGQVVSALSPGAQPVFSVLVPNLKGYELALESGIRDVEMVIYGSDGMAQNNAAMDAADAEAAALEMLQKAAADGVTIGATVAVAFECPFDGPVPSGRILKLAERMLQAGLPRLTIADTIGAAHPGQVHSLMQSLVDAHGADRLACHFHDTRAMGLANVYAAVETGIRRFDAAIGGLGGCPFAPGASGNVATEDVVMMLEQMGFQTGIDLGRLMAASRLATELTGTAPGGRARAWLERELQPGG